MTDLVTVNLSLESQTSDPSSPVDGFVWYNSTAQEVRVRQGGFTVPIGGSGITIPQHRALDQLVHDIAETSYLELTRTAGRVSGITYWTDSGKTPKIRETTITRTAGQVSTVVVKQYDGSGLLAETLTGTVTRTLGQVSSIDWVLT